MKTRYFLIFAVIFSSLGWWQVNAHKHRAATLAANLVASDEAGRDTTAEQDELRSYTAAHMSTGRSVTLTGSYNRALAAAKAATQSGANGQIYSQAQAACASHADSIVQARCVQAYVAAHSASGANPQPVAMPNQSDYIKSFNSPNWTPDSSGLAYLAGVVFAAFGIYLWLLRRL